MSTISYWSQSSVELVDEAEKLGLEVEILDKEKNLFFIKNHSKKILFKSTDFGGNSSLAFKICNDKSLSHTILEEIGAPIAKTLDVSQERFKTLKKEDVKDFHFPLIIKPVDE